MIIRSTPGLATDFAISRLNQQSGQLQQLQQQLSTGSRLNRPSDDPLAVRRSLLQQDRISRLDAAISAVQGTRSRLNQAHVQLRDAQQIFVRAREIALSARQATDESERRIFADEVQGLIDQLFSIANASDESGYLFSGKETGTQPFALSESGKDVVYSGSSESVQLLLAGEADRATLAPGDQIFLASDRQETLIIGDTGIQSGSGVDTASGTLRLEVAHTSTSYSTGGVAPGTSSAGGDTVVGALGTNTLQINDTSGTGASGTISLNGGAEFTFTSADTDLQVIGPSGEVVYVDTTSITPGFSGTVDILASGTVSVDGGTTTTAIDFSTNQQIVDPATGDVIYLDTSTVRRTGTDDIEFVGTANAFTALIELRDELRNGDSRSAAEYQDALGRRLGEIERVQSQLLDELGIQSVAIENLDRLIERSEDLRLEQQAAYAETADADFAAATLNLQQLLNLQQFTMAAVSRLTQPSLLQFLN